MARPPSPLDLSLHPHFGILAQRRRGFFRDPDKAAIETRRVPIDRRSPSRDQPLPLKSTINSPNPSWTADPNKIIAAVKRGHQVLDSIH